MGNRTTRPMATTEHSIIWVFGKFDTNNTSAPDGIKGDISTVTRAGAGDFDLVLTEQYYDAVHWDAKVLGSATLGARVTAFDPQAGTMSVEVFTESTGVVADSTDVDVRIAVAFRNSKLGSWT